jgi:hypothetical protein
VVIDQRVDVVETDRGFVGARVVVGVGLPVGSPAAAGRDLAELLYVHVHQVPGLGTFVADRGDLAGSDHLPGDRVQDCQRRDLVTSQDPRHRAGRHAEFGTEPVRATTLEPAQLDHPGLELGTGPGRTVARA